MKKVEEHLSLRNLRPTPCRVAMIQTFLKMNRALSQPELEKIHGRKFSRVTLYRTLATFVEAGVLHGVLDDSGSTKYALCSMKCTDHKHHDAHVHFKCSRCGATRCIEEVSLPAVKLPNGFRSARYNLLVEGICDRCS